MSELDELMTPGATLPDELYAWVTVTTTGRPSLIGIVTELGHTPLIVASWDVAEALKPFAEGHAKSTGQRSRLVRFTMVEILCEIPGGAVQ